MLKVCRTLIRFVVSFRATISAPLVPFKSIPNIKHLLNFEA